MVLDFAEFDDLIELSVNLPLLHSENRAVKINILPTRQFSVESGTDLKKARNLAFYLDRSFRR